MNVAAAKSFGTENPREVIGKSDFDLHAPELAENFTAEERHMLDSGIGLYDQEQLTYDPDTGQEVWLSTTKMPVIDAEGTIKGLVGFAENITQRKHFQQQLEEKSAVVEAQQEALLELSTPILPIFDNILALPLIGAIDSQRAANIMRALLAGISEHRAKIVILDITGVPLIDTGIADNLHRTIQAARLKGAKTIITGVSDAVAETLVDLGIDWSSVQTLNNLQSGLLAALKMMDDKE